MRTSTEPGPVAADVPTLRTFADDIAEQARRRPAATAVSTPDGDVSYGELAARIDRAAGVLAAGGVGPEHVCAVAVTAGVDAIVAMAAVVRAGGAFLTLDVEQPAARLAALVHSGHAWHLVSTPALAGTLDLPLPRLLLDGPATATPVGPAGPEALAYVSHTSGSTGDPSAVLIEHRGLASYLRFVVRDYTLDENTVALQAAPLGYDASIRDTLAPLVAGGRLVVVPRSTLLRPDEFAAAVRRFGVNTLLSVTPSFLSFLAGRPDLDPLHGVRLVVSSGESLRPFLAAGGRRLVSGRLVNQYGPTECTMTSTRHAVPAEPDTAADLVGTPIDGVTVRLLDGNLAPAPVGEVCIGGVGVARGYCGQPARTAERFVPDPAGPPGARLYRTGDLARRGADAVLEYLGRLDRQVKIRGYRVDPAEVEGALLTHPAVTAAVVTAATDDRGRVHLIAHLAGELDGVADGALRAHLGRTLPPYLMPRRFVRLTAVPTTRGGKADRRALAAAARAGIPAAGIAATAAAGGAP